jgi:hypothetical protein
MKASVRAVIASRLAATFAFSTKMHPFVVQPRPHVHVMGLLSCCSVRWADATVGPRTVSMTANMMPVVPRNHLVIFFIVAAPTRVVRSYWHSCLPLHTNWDLVPRNADHR